MRGSYIMPEESNEPETHQITFKISEQIHNSLRDIAQEILPLASYYICVQKFVKKSSSSTCGQVLQALSAALRGLTHDYYVSNNRQKSN